MTCIRNNGDAILYWKNTVIDVMLREACVRKRDAPKCVRIRLWLLRCADSARVLIGAAGMRRSDWRRRNVGAMIGQRACRVLALAREAIDSTRAGASGSLQAAIASQLAVPWARWSEAFMDYENPLPIVNTSFLIRFSN